LSKLGEQLFSQVAEHVAKGRIRLAIVGLTPAGLELMAAAEEIGGHAALFDPTKETNSQPHLSPWADLAEFEPDVVVIASDEDKERLLLAAALILDGRPAPHCVLGGLKHQEVSDSRFADLEAPALVPSYATGHPHTRVHLFDCLRSAGAHGHSGAIVELGAFKGGTSVWLAKAAEQLGLHDSPVIAFDAWDGFPPRRSLLDLYEHPRCVFRDFEAVRSYTEPYGIELVAGDIYETAPSRLANEPVLLAFVDTDNYSGTRRALETIVPNLVAGGSIVFDHYFTTSDYVYTIGERIAAQQALSEAGFFHLHGTGVFLKTD